MSVFKKQILFLAVIFLTGITGCNLGGTLSPSDGSSSPVAQVSSITLSTPSPAASVRPSPTPKASPQPSPASSPLPQEARLEQLSAPELSASWRPEKNFGHSAVSTQVLKTTLKIPLGWVYAAASVAIRSAVKNGFETDVVEIESSPDRSYRVGEIPLGMLLGPNSKRLMSVHVPTQEMESGDFRMKLDTFDFPVLMNRTQRSGEFRERRLDSGAIETIKSSPRLGDDVSLRFSPATDGLGGRIDACVAVPGFTVSVPSRTLRVHGSYHKVIRIGASTDVEVRFGNASFDYVRGCFSSSIVFPENGFVPRISLKAIDAPRVENARFQGFDIRFKDWWARFIDSVLSLFKASVRQKINRIVAERQQQLLDSEIESGAWFARIHGEEALHSASRSINRVVSASILSAGVPATGGELRSFLERQCELLPIFSTVDLSFRQVCREALALVTLSVKPFYRDPAQVRAGCYESYGNVHETRDAQGKFKAWARECGFALQMQLEVPASIAPGMREALTRLVDSADDLLSWLDVAAQRFKWSGDQRMLLLFAVDMALQDGRAIDRIEDLPAVLERYQPVVEELFRKWGATE